MVSIIRTRGQLIQYIKENLSPHYRSIHRALEEGMVKNLGGFGAIPPPEAAGWIVKVRSTRDSCWYIAVACSKPGYQVWPIDESDIPWEESIAEHFGSDPLYAGDK